MNKIIRLAFFLFFVLFFLGGCMSNEVIENDDIFELKNSFVGDNGAVGKITRELPNPHGEQLSGLELQTTEEPYGIILNYTIMEDSEGMKTNYKELVLYNATFILSLVHNADWVTFNFVEQGFVVNREDLQSFYGKDIREFNSEDELSLFIQEYLIDEHRVDQFYDSEDEL